MAKTSKMVYVGIDPGINGGICLIFPDANIHHIEIHKCPATIRDMSDILDDWIDPASTVRAVIEKVHAFPGQGVTSMFNFGKNFGTWLGILNGLRIPYVEVSPQKWMRVYGSMPKDKKDRKNHLKGLAQSLYPQEKITLKTADAVLLAHFSLGIGLMDNVQVNIA